ncbi:MAG TPA: hypothetical protein VHQ01_07515, partial [Pyrinomonadaceae bacterium]|nr:hypothetical protein [Pyrinomonadaceae bacterium]
MFAIPVVFLQSVSAQTQDNTLFALQRGFRTGYSDGYMAGYRDTIDSMSRSYNRHGEYAKADRAYNKDYGSREDFRDGYQQGFESGYDTGFDRRTFESNLPSGLKRRGVLVGENQNLATNSDSQQQQTDSQPDAEKAIQNNNSSDSTSSNQNQGGGPTIIIPRETELIIELQEDISTEHSRAGDKFTAKVVSPSEMAGATIEGRISKIVQPGRIKRQSEMLLSFDRVILADGRWSNFNAQLIEVMPIKGDNVKLVDNEGTAIGQSSLKSDAVKVGGATGAGTMVGAVVGGPVGAAVGAGMGAAFGVGAVVIERGKHIKLNHNQQIRVKTAYETQIR